MTPDLSHILTAAATLATAVGGDRIVRAWFGRGRQKAKAAIDDAKAKNVQAEADQASLTSLSQLLVLYQTQLVQQGGRLDREIIKGEAREARILDQERKIIDLTEAHRECERREADGQIERQHLLGQVAELKADLESIKSGGLGK